MPVQLTDTEQLFDILSAKTRQDASVVLAIDGPCGSGKTTLAQQLQHRLGAAIIPMDDFFLPQELRTNERYETPGGNVHYERFLEEVAPFLRSRNPHSTVSYRPFDCTLMSYGPVRTVSFSKLTIVEGSYSLHDALRPLYDMRLFLSIDPVEQERRLRSRVDDERIHAFMQRWIPLEELYFKNMKPHEHCDYIL